MNAGDEHRKRIEKSLVARGDLYVEVDGYWVYGPRQICGFVDAEGLRVIADILDEKNAAWHAQMQKDLAEYGTKEDPEGL